MLLQRRIVIILNDYFIDNGRGLSREDLVVYVAAKKLWPRLYYLWPREDKFRNRVDQALGDCIRGEFGYIEEDDDGQTLLVTPKGRDFVSILSGGFLEEYLKRRRRSSGYVIAVVTSGFIFTVIQLVAKFWQKFL